MVRPFNSTRLRQSASSLADWSKFRICEFVIDRQYFASPVCESVYGNLNTNHIKMFQFSSPVSPQWKRDERKKNDEETETTTRRAESNDGYSLIQLLGVIASISLSFIFHSYSSCSRTHSRYRLSMCRQYKIVLIVRFVCIFCPSL